MGIEEEACLSKKKREERKNPVQQRPQDPTPRSRERSGGLYLVLPARRKRQGRIEVVPPCKAF